MITWIKEAAAAKRPKFIKKTFEMAMQVPAHRTRTSKKLAMQFEREKKGIYIG